ncbi:MAG: hypothetical protein OXU45_02365 [Candidatus Melainabacteria bacterium]|nr:hypothetical protein [Candidatus Melainabacteria bacterium]
MKLQLKQAPHPSDFRAEHFIGFDKFLSKDFPANKFPHNSLELRKSETNKGNLVISVAEDQPQTLLSILETIDRLIRLDSNEDLFPNRNIYCVYSTNAENHNRQMAEFLAQHEGEDNISLAILDGCLSNSDTARARGMRQDFGHEIYYQLLEAKRAGKFSDLFCQFQSSEPDFIISAAYDFDKEFSGFNAALPTELKRDFNDFENLQICTGLSHRYQSISRPDGRSFENTARWDCTNSDELAKQLKSWFSKIEKNHSGLSAREMALYMIYLREMSLGMIVPVSAETGDLRMDPEKSSNYSIFESLDIGRVQAHQLENYLKDSAKTVVSHYLDNIEQLDSFIDSRRALVTNKLEANMPIWLGKLFEAISSIIQ